MKAMNREPAHLAVKALICKTVGGGSAGEVAAARSYETRDVLAIEKAAVDAISGATDRGAFTEAVAAQSVFGRAGFQLSVLNTRVNLASGAKGTFVAEGASIPLSKEAVTGQIISPRKVNALACVTNESLRAQGATMERAIDRDLRNAAVYAIDNALLSPSVDDSLTNGVTPVTATDVKDAVSALVDAYDGDLRTAVFVCDGAVGVKLGLAFGDKAGALGGFVVGIPLVTSSASPKGQLALIDAAGVFGNVQDVELDESGVTTLEMSDAPTQDSSTPTGSTSMVSMYQTNTTALKLTVFVGFVRTGDAQIWVEA